MLVHRDLIKYFLCPFTQVFPFNQEAQCPPLPATERGRPTVLGEDPNGVNFLYTNGRSVIIRNLANPESCSEYVEHAQNVTVARYAPSGNYIASAGLHT